MRVINEYSQKNGKDFISRMFSRELSEIYSIIGSVNLENFKTKVSKEKTMPGERQIYRPL